MCDTVLTGYTETEKPCSVVSAVEVQECEVALTTVHLSCTVTSEAKAKLKVVCTLSGW